MKIFIVFLSITIMKYSIECTNTLCRKIRVVDVDPKDLEDTSTLYTKDGKYLEIVCPKCRIIGKYPI